MDAPPIAAVGKLIGDPTRALMLAALMDGRARTATELAVEAGVGRATASSHLARLTERGLLCVASQGRHRYFRLASDEVASMLESLMVFGAATPVAARVRRTTPEREARTCYDHLAGRLGVGLLDGLQRKGCLVLSTSGVTLSTAGRDLLCHHGIEVDTLARRRRPLARLCLDWSERRNHLAGGLGAALLDLLLTRGWVRGRDCTRAVTVTRAGRRALNVEFGVDV